MIDENAQKVRPKLKDVARNAGVSPTTASMVFTGTGRMVGALDIFPDPRVDLVIVIEIQCRLDFITAISVHGGLAQDLTCQLETVSPVAAILLRRKIVKIPLFYIQKRLVYSCVITRK